MIAVVMLGERGARVMVAVCLLIAGGLAIAGLMWFSPGPAPAARTAASGHNAARRGSAHRSVAVPHAVAATVAAVGGGPGSPVADLSALTPVQVYNVSGLRTGPAQIGATTYDDSVRFTCDSGGRDSSGDLDYVVTGYRSMSAMVGVPAGDSRAARDAMTVSFFNNGSGVQTSEPVTITTGHPRRVRLSFQGASQLEISCSAVNTASGAATYMEVALGNATISSR
jgi:hypothetical protein